ncbi:squalene/phytoene synthase family protein [Sphingomonas tabacisoli]|uniref:Squalene/phytoene synthase family protein n=1 Tax=Sphingomonas tabacisoli TaxID=2249466 RepID=A0ABW4I0T9_9SPHN
MPLPVDPERALSLAYAPAPARAALSALWRLDEQLGASIVRTETPAVAQMRLVWWHDALKTLCTDRPVDPILVTLAEAPGIDPEALLPLIDGWEVLLEPLPLSEEALATYAGARGGTLFGVVATLLGGDADASEQAGRGWALADLAFRISDRVTAERALALAGSASHGRLPKPLAILAALARRDVRRGLNRPRRQGSPMRVARAMVAGLTGL